VWLQQVCRQRFYIKPFETIPAFTVNPEIKVESINIEVCAIDDLFGIDFVSIFVSL